MTTDDLLKQGIAALKDGRKAQARSLLTQVVEQDERNEMAWLWLSGAVDTDEDRRICLENVLAINPDNQAAQRGLKILRQKASVPLLQRAEGLAPLDVAETVVSIEPATKLVTEPRRPKVAGSTSEAKSTARTAIGFVRPSSQTATKSEVESSGIVVGCLIVIGLVIATLICVSSGGDVARQPTATPGLISRIEDANGYDWQSATEADRIALCEWLNAKYRTKMENPPGWRFLYDGLNEIYRTDDPYTLRQRIMEVAPMLVVMAGYE